MLRALLVLLILVNGVYFAWTRGALMAFGLMPATLTEREPQRMAQQVHPNAIQVKPAESSPQSAR